jgi:hypothetical protein
VKLALLCRPRGISIPKCPAPYWDGSRFLRARVILSLGSLLIVFLTGCCGTAKLPNRPNAAGVVASNKATVGSIGEARGLIKKSQAAAAKGNNSLDKASKQIDILLGP